MRHRIFRPSCVPTNRWQRVVGVRSISSARASKPARSVRRWTSWRPYRFRLRRVPVLPTGKGEALLRYILRPPIAQERVELADRFLELIGANVGDDAGKRLDELLDGPHEVVALHDGTRA